MRPILFIDRDGVLIEEPSEDQQIDSLEKLVFKPRVICALRKIREEADFLFVMVTNQDGLGTATFPEDAFYLAHNKMLEILEGEGVAFDAVHIDRSWPEEKLPTRKPGTGMLTEYLSGNYDLDRSLVVGDRLTDIELAANIGCQAIWFAPEEQSPRLVRAASESGTGDRDLSTFCSLVSDDWNRISRFITGSLLPLPCRQAKIYRSTSETKIRMQINLDGTGKADISTGLRFFDHMLEQVARHSLCDLAIAVEGDIDVDEHHTIEDTALALGQAFLEALGDKLGISRYGFSLPMDDARAQAAVDFSGRPWIVWEADFPRNQVGGFPTEMFFHFFKSFSDAARCNLQISAAGDNTHHLAEAIFKAFARAIRGAVKRDLYNMQLPSTKGVL